MKGFRRSLNKDKIGAPTPTYSSLPTAGFPSTSQAAQQHQQAQVQGARLAGSSGSSFHGAASNSQHNGASAAPAPPKRVIRAINDYTARSSHELSFAQGDFFHVVSDDGGEDWFDAANPMTGARGMVPADCFQVLGRNVRETAQQQQQGSLGRKTSRSTSVGAGSMSGQPSPTYSAQGQSVKQNQQSRSSSSQPAGLASSSSSMSSQQQLQRQQQQQAPAAAHKPQPLYGIVQYDFVAERADELDAKRGEPIIVIAQSNHEWFVAKPIGRLGGPGLIPVAFVEIQDMTTGKPVENVEELIRSAVVPKVEEWKKMTADYKSASIPLGRFDFASTPAATTQLSQQQAPSTQTPVSPTATYSSRGDQRYSDQQPGSHTQSTTDPARHQSGQYDVNDEGDTRRYSYSRERRQFGLVTAASVESFHHEEGSYWFHLRAFFSTGASLVLYRLYQDFYDFQIALMDEFPVEAGRIPPGPGQEPERILPMMPGPTDYEDDIVCAQRVHDLSLYLGDLCALPERIRGSGLMYEFLVPRAGDVEVAKGNGQGDRPGGGAAGHGGHGHGHGHGASIDGRYGEVVEYLDQMDGGRAARVSNDNSAANHLEDGMARLSMNGTGGSSVRNSYTNSQQTQPRTESRQSRTSSTGFGARSDAYQQASAPKGTANLNVPFIKIKIFHRNTDDLIAIRVPPTVSHAQLLDKVRERLGSEVVNLRFREEVGSTAPSSAQVVMAGGARLVSVLNDDDLERWIRSGARLVLYAD